MKLKAGLLVPPGAGPVLIKTLLIMKLSVVLLLVTCLQVHASGYAQKITLNKKNASLKEVFRAIKEQTSYHFFYKDELLKNTGTVDVNVKDVSVEVLLSECLKQFPLTYTIINRTIIIKKKTEQPVSEASVRQPAKTKADTTITGRVMGINGAILSNVSVSLKGTSIGTTTNEQGYFSLNVPEGRANGILVVSSVGYKPLEISLSGKKQITIQLDLESKDLGEVVVVGYGTQRKAHLTGAVSSIKGEEIVTTKNENVTEHADRQNFRCACHAKNS